MQNINLSGSPYFDDFSPSKRYYQVLFKPSVAVQTRELNYLQSMLQNQIEKFGNSVLTQGTILEGCSFSYNPSYPYVKLLDSQIDGNQVNVSNYIGYYTKNSSNLVAQVINGSTGYVSQDPYLNTIYLRYTNSGNTGNLTSYSANDILTVYDINYPIEQVNVINGGNGFQNTDAVVFIPALSVSGANTFTVGELITQSSTNAHAIITEVNNSILANTLVLKIKPQTSDLLAQNTNGWTFAQGFNITSNTTNSVANVTQVLGQYANATPITDSLGIVQQVIMANNGVDYVVTPYTTISPKSNTAGLSTLNLQAQNYIAEVTVSSTANSVGFGYSFGVSNGVIYQNGYFLEVDAQTVIVDPYSQSPDKVAVGFTSQETIVTAYNDSSLFDNVTGSPNEFAPGADRLQIIPQLVVVTADDANANTNFFKLTEFSLGQPYLQNQQTQFSVINDELAQRTYETSGNFVIDPFNLSTQTSASPSDGPSYFRVTIDPGQAYINGYRVKTYTNYAVSVRKGTDTNVATQNSISMNYGNYITCQEVGGVIDSAIGPLVELHNSSKSYISNGAYGYQTGNAIPSSYTIISGYLTTGSNVVSNLVSNTGISVGTYLSPLVSPGITLGTYVTSFVNSTAINISSPYLGSNAQQNVAFTSSLIGTARIRGSQQISGTPGTANATYNYYLYDVNMTTGYSFRGTKSIHTWNSSSNLHGIADVVLAYDPISGTNVASIANSSQNQFIFTLSANNVKSTQNHSYVYRNSKVVTTNGSSSSNNLTISGLASNEYHPYTNNAVLSQTQLRDLVLIPEQNLIFQSNISGTSYANSTLTLSTTSNISVGDYLYIYQTGTSDLRHITNIINTTAVTLDSNTSGSSSANVALVFPEYVPIPLVNRSNRSAFLDASGKNLTVSFGNTVASGNVYVIHNVLISNTNSLPTKTPSRNNMVILNLSNNQNGSVGPWSLGVPDIFRLRNVYLGNSSVVNTSSLDVTSEFYIDHNQTFNILGNGNLYQRPTSNLVLSTSEQLLVVFDNFIQSSYGPTTVSSYSIDPNADSLSLANLSSGSNVSLIELSEVYSKTGQYIDVIDSVDFRPYETATANITSNLSLVTVNPPSINAAVKYSYTGNAVQKYPIPNGLFTADISFYLGRIDRIVIDDNGNIFTVEGVPGVDENSLVEPPEPANTMTINLIYVPPYPTIPDQQASYYVSVIDKSIASQNFTLQRQADHTVSIVSEANTNITLSQPMGYTMKDIASLDNRISALEQAMSLSVLEQELNNITIPSSVNNAINAFKYGFFADDFSTLNYTDMNNPEYSTQIVNNEVVPDQYNINIEFDYNVNDSATVSGVTGPALTLPYVEFNLLSQSYATDGVVFTPVIVANTQVINSIVTPVQSIVCSLNSGNSIGGGVQYLLSSTSNTATLVFGSNDSTNRTWEVWQSNSQSNPQQTLLYTANNGVALSNSQLSDFLTGAGNSSDLVSPASLNIISFIYNPSNGRYLSVYTDSVDLGAEWIYRFCYPIDSTLVLSGTANTSNQVIVTPGVQNSVPVVIQNTTPTVSLPPQPTIFDGQLVANPGTVQISSIFNNYTIVGVTNTPTSGNSQNYVASSNKIQLIASGLKPSTKHDFYVGNTISTLFCVSNGAYVNTSTLSIAPDIWKTAYVNGYIQQFTSTNFSNNMVSDSTGKLVFDFYYDSAIYLESNAVIGSVNNLSTSYNSLITQLNRMAGNKVLTLTTSDNTSIAATTLTVIPGNVVTNTSVATTAITGSSPAASVAITPAGGIGWRSEGASRGLLKAN